MWCDDFDGDLYKLVPAAREVIAPLRDLKLWTTGHETGGKLNHPTTWNTNGPSNLAWFGLTAKAPQPSFYYSGSPLIACTLEEAVRDIWCHGPIILRIVTDPETYVDLWDSYKVQGSFWKLLYLSRGWMELARDADPDRERGHVLAVLHALVRTTRQIGLIA